jgi:hypothetical protein
VQERINNAHPFECTQIGYHGNYGGWGDPFYLANPTENDARANYYDIEGAPSLRIDGIIDAGSEGPWEAMMLARHAVPSPLAITVSGHMLSADTGEITADIENTSASGVDGALHFVLVEDDILFEGTNWINVMRDFFPGDAAGEAIVVGPGETLVRTAPFIIAGGWVRQNMQALVFVQNDATKEVLQTGRIFFELDGPELVAAGVSFDDSAGGDGDGHPDPGESVLFFPALYNLNPGTATEVTGTCSTTDDHVTIDEASASWPDIAYGEIQSCNDDPIALSIDELAPSGGSAAVTITLAAEPGGFTGTAAFEIPIGSPDDPIGPDAHGYFAYENADACALAPAFSWVEIDPNLGGSGTLVALTNDQTRQFDLPFPFHYYGLRQRRISICSNGWVALGNTGLTSPSNVGIPNPIGPSNMIAAFWDDLDPAGTASGKVYTAYDAARHRYIIEYSGVRHHALQGIGAPETFEIIFYDPAYDYGTGRSATPTGDGRIVVQYALVSDASSCTVGIEDGTETIGIQYLFDGALNPAATGLVAGRAISYTTRRPSRDLIAMTTAAPLPAMLQARPNPTRRDTQIHFDLRRGGEVSLLIFGPDGALVRTLIDGAVAAGPGSVAWDGRDQRGRLVPDGVYFCRLRAPDIDADCKIVERQ